MTKRRASLLVLVLALAGCGGGSGGTGGGNLTIAPSITTQPSSQTVTAGQAATFMVVATGTAPSYSWSKDGVAIAGATSFSYTTPNTTAADNGSKFVVTVSNSAGTATSSAAVLTVNAAPIAPTITAQPSNQTATAGQTATFTVIATGTSPLNYQWSKGGVAIPGATSADYTTPATVIGDSGSVFTVVVSNVAGNQTSNAATLTVNPVQNPAPVIAGVSPAVVVPGHASFTLTVSGQNFLPNSVIQVNGSSRSTSFMNGTQISTMITAADAANSGQITITVVNPAPGGGASNNIMLIVNTSVSAAAVYSLKITDPNSQFGTSVKYLGNVTGASGSSAIGITLPASAVYMVLNPESHPGQFTSSQIGSASLPGVKFTYSGPSSGALFFVIASAGDVDGDGINDILISLNTATTDPTNKPCAGTVFVVQGGSWLLGRTAVDLNDTTLPIVRMEGVGATDCAGQSLANGKDFNGDGKADIAFSAPGYNGLRGAVYLVYGQSAFFSQKTIDLTQVGAQIDGAIFTRSSSPGLASGLGSVSPGSETISIGGDLNGDGLPELLIGDTAAQNQTPNTQKTYAVFGSTGLRGTFFVEDIGKTFNGATFFADRAQCGQTPNLCYSSFGSMVAGRDGSVMISNPLGGPGGGSVSILEQVLTNGQLIDVRLAPQTAQATDLWDFSTAQELTGSKMRDGADFRMISMPGFNQHQGRFVVVAGSQLPTGNNVDIATVIKLSIVGESATSGFSFGLDRSADGAYIAASSTVGSAGVVYLIPRANLLF